MTRGGDGPQLRVVVDTNVYISALLHPERPIFQILQKATEQQYRLLISPPIVTELGRILRDTFGVTETVRLNRLKALIRTAEIITPTITLDVIREDPPDNRILECAVAGQADLIVSGNRHVRRLKVYDGIPIVSPTDFLRTLGVSLTGKRRERRQPKP